MTEDYAEELEELHDLEEVEEVEGAAGEAAAPTTGKAWQHGYPYDRKLPREEIVVPSEFGLIRMKRIMTLDGVRIAPEYDEARRIARERAIPLHAVLMKLDEVARRVADEMPERTESSM